MVNMDVFILQNTVLNILTKKKNINSRAVEQDLSRLISSHELHQTVTLFPDIMKNGNKLCRDPHPSGQLLK